jgi:hypothetical protein
MLLSLRSLLSFWRSLFQQAHQPPRSPLALSPMRQF